MSETGTPYRTAEHDIQSLILEALDRAGALAIRVNSGLVKLGGRHVRLAPKGTSDIIALYRGWYLAIEVKRPGESLSDEQRAFLVDVEECGGKAVVAYSVEDVVSALAWVDAAAKATNCREIGY